MREWIEDLSEWMQSKEKISVSPLPDLSQEMEQTSHETNTLLETTDHLQSIYSQLKEKVGHDNLRR